MNQRNIVSVSWGDHIIFGEGDGRLANPDALQRRMIRWRDDLGAAIIHWRVSRMYIKGRYHIARGHQTKIPAQIQNIDWNDFKVVPCLAHDLGLKAYLYVSLFDEGFPLAPKKIRGVSYHNKMHCQHITWQSEFSRTHPEYVIMDRSSKHRQWGVLCLAYPEVRTHIQKRFLRFLKDYEFDGLFVCLRSQSHPADFADQYGFNEPIRKDFLTRYGRDICTQDFDLQAWRDLLGEYLTTFLSELNESIQPLGIRLAVGTARGDILGPPLGNTTLEWRKWIGQKLIDELIINQNSSQCPSMWHQLWPMHRGHSYLKNYINCNNMPPLTEHLSSTYAPIITTNKTVDLYVARQWNHRSPVEEDQLLAHPIVKGLVFGSFRHDNLGPIAHGDWTA